MKTYSDYRLLLDTFIPLLRDRDQSIIRKGFEIVCNDYAARTAPNNISLMDHVLRMVRVIAIEFNLGFTSTLSALLAYADTRNEGVVNFIKSNKLHDVSKIIESFHKINELPTDRLLENIDNYTGIMLSMATDVRSIFLSFADNLCLLRSPEHTNKQILDSILVKTSGIYLPLAHKLGLYPIKSEMEEITFKLREPIQYKELASRIDKEVNKSKDFIMNFTEPIIQDLDRLSIKYSVKSRTKTVSSVHNKMVKQKVPFNEIYDLFAIRIITDSDLKDEKADCWKVYSVITNLYTPEPSRMRDWITRPRANGYESLHITVRDKSGRWVEVQIRSLRMDKDAESGSAAHWRYKGHKDTLDTSTWMAHIRQILENPDNTGESLFEQPLSPKISDNLVYVFTPAGDLIRLAEGATVLDFAFELHTAIGSRCSGGRVNGKIVPIRQSLKNGDVVEILTSKNQTPNIDWLGWVVTSRAKSKIRRFLKEAEFKLAEVGKDILRRKLGQLKLQYNDETVNKLINYFKFETSLALYQQLAENKIDTSQIKEVLLSSGKEVSETNVPRESTKEVTRHPDRTSENTITVNESAELQGYMLAQCCNPVMGDEIFGFVMAAGGIKIHRMSCPNALRLRTRYPYRIVNAQWSKVAEGSYFISTLYLNGVDQLGILNSITDLLSKELKVDVRNITLNSKDGRFEGYIKISVRDSRHIDSLIKKVSNIKGVSRVKRIH